MLVSVGVLDILLVLLLFHFFFFKQKTAYEMRISDWSSDVCSSDLRTAGSRPGSRRALKLWRRWRATTAILVATRPGSPTAASSRKSITRGASRCRWAIILGWSRSEEHTSELQSLMRISYAVFFLKKKKTKHLSHSCTLIYMTHITKF